eukprot:1158015-Pelagomonas_calceolata.AAC.4
MHVLTPNASALMNNASEFSLRLCSPCPFPAGQSSWCLHAACCDGGRGGVNRVQLAFLELGGKLV